MQLLIPVRSSSRNTKQISKISNSNNKCGPTFDVISHRKEMGGASVDAFPSPHICQDTKLWSAWRGSWNNQEARAEPVLLQLLQLLQLLLIHSVKYLSTAAYSLQYLGESLLRSWRWNRIKSDGTTGCWTFSWEGWRTWKPKQDATFRMSGV